MGNKAIIVGAPHHNSLGLVRSLGIKGLKPDVYLISPNKKLGCMKSKYIGEVIFFDSANNLVKYLIGNKPLEGKHILFASGDPISAAIDREYENLKDGYAFFNTCGITASWMNKEKMCELAFSIGMNVPQHVIYNVGDQIPEDIEFPCITKAISSIDGTKADTTICQNLDELKLFLSTPNLCPKIQIEKFIEKEIEFQFLGVSLDGGNEIIIPGHTHIDRPNGIQNTFYFHYKENDETFDEILNKSFRFIKKTRYSGLFSIEFLRDKDGVDYFLEMNFRNDGNAICVTDAGYNLPYIWYLYNSGGDYKKELKDSIFSPVRYCPEYFYTMQCAFGEVPFLLYLKNILSANSFTDYYKGDSPLYFFKFTKFLIKNLVIRKFLIKIGIMRAPKESIG